MTAQERVICYIDGFNLYFGLKESHFERYLWLDVGALAQSLLRPDQVLVAAKYFTARISGPPDKQTRQATYLAALHEHTRCPIIEGRYQDVRVECRKCHGVWVQHQEKATDVNIAVEMLTDAMADAFDAALLVSGDADLIPAIAAVRKPPQSKRVVCAFPPNRTSAEIARVNPVCFTIGRKKLATSQMPVSVTVAATGAVLSRPPSWK